MTNLDILLLSVCVILVLLPPKWDPAIRLKWQQMGYDPIKPEIPYHIVLLFVALFVWFIAIVMGWSAAS